jgi:hypothetical protein
MTAIYSGDANYATSTSPVLAYLGQLAGTISAVGSLQTSSGEGVSTLSVDPQHVGDVLVLSGQVWASSVVTTSVTGGGATWQELEGVSNGTDAEMWLGTITTTGTSTITLSYSGSIATLYTEINAQEFASSTGAGTAWSVDRVGRAIDSTTTSAMDFPALTSRNAGELYVGYATPYNFAVAGSTSGVTYDVSSNGNLFVYDTSVSGTLRPIGAQTPSGAAWAVGALLKATATTSSAVGSLQQASSTGLSTLSVSPQQVGDAMVLSLNVNSPSVTVSSVSGDGATWHKLTSSDNGTTDAELWYATVSTTGSTTITVTYSSSVASIVVGLQAQEFASTYGSATTWSSDVVGSLNNTSSSAVAFPSLTPTGTGELYVGYAGTTSTAVAGTTIGFTYYVTGTTGLLAGNPNVSAASGPTATQTTAGTSVAVGALLKATQLSLSTTTTTLTSSLASPQSAATSLMLSATVSHVGATYPAGGVNFEIGGASIVGCSAQPLTSGVATCTTSALAPGVNSFTALYSGDTNYVTSVSSPLPFEGLAAPGAPSVVTATPENGNVLVSWTAPTSTNGLAIEGYTVTASVPRANGQIPTCTATAPATSCTVPDLTIGTSVTFSVSATTSGGTGATSSSSAVTPTLLASSTTLTASPLGFQVVGSPVTFSAVIVPTGVPVAKGTVAFDLVVGTTDTPITGCTAQHVSSNDASCTTSALTTSASPYSVVAIYSGDTNYATSTSMAMSYVVATSLTAPTTPLSITSTSSPYNAALTLTTSAGSGTGAISFTVRNGTANCTLSGTNLSVSTSGTCLVTANQAGDSTHLAQSSNETTVNFYWQYAASWAVVSSTPVYTYSCSSGTRSGTTCLYTYGATPATTYSCPSGWTSNGDECERTVTSLTTSTSCSAAGDTWSGGACHAFLNYTSATTYSCPSGGTLYSTVCQTTYAATPTISGYSNVYGYTCPLGGTLTAATNTCSLAGGSGPNLRDATALRAASERPLTGADPKNTASSYSASHKVHVSHQPQVVTTRRDFLDGPR